MRTPALAPTMTASLGGAITLGAPASPEDFGDFEGFGAFERVAGSFGYRVRPGR